MNSQTTTKKRVSQSFLVPRSPLNPTQKKKWKQRDGSVLPTSMRRLLMSKSIALLPALLVHQNKKDAVDFTYEEGIFKNSFQAVCIFMKP